MTDPEPAMTHTHTHTQDLVLRVKPTATMHGRERPVSEPAPALSFGHNSAGWGWVVNTRQKSLKGGQRTEDYKREAERPSPTLTGQAGGFWQWERPATTVCADPRIPAPGYRTGSERSLTPATPATPAALAAAGNQDGTEAIKLTVEEALILQGFRPDYPLQGSRSKRFEQIGNAVPPPVAAAVLRQLLD